MRSDLVRIYKVVHTWTGLLAGMALFIAFYAGGLTLFKDTLTRWASPPTPPAPTVSLDEVPVLLARVIARSPEAARDLRVHLDPRPPKERLEWEARPPGVDEHDNVSVRHFRATIDADGSERLDEIRRTHVAEFLDVLHRVVGLPVDRDEYRWIMGAVAVLYGLALFSGVVILAPSLVKDLFAFRVGPNLKRMWLDAHNIVGLLSLPFHIVMAVSAVVFAFHDGIYVLQDRVVHGGKLGSIFGRAAPANEGPRDPATMVPPTEIVARVAAVAPSFEPETLEYLQVTGPRAMVRVWGHDRRELAFRAPGGIALVDPYSGRVVSTDYLPGHQGAAATVITSVFALHFGSFGGQPVKVIYLCLALLGAWLFYSGNLLWIETRRRKASRRDAGSTPRQRRDARLMASATVGVCFGAVCGISSMIAATKWLSGHVGDPNALHRGVYYAVFFFSVGWSVLRGPARAAVDLLRLATVTTAAIPATTLLAWAVPALGMWAHTSGDALGVDVVALALALGFATMTRATKRRVEDGPPDSVWSLHARDAAASTEASA